MWCKILSNVNRVKSSLNCFLCVTQFPKYFHKSRFLQNIKKQQEKVPKNTNGIVIERKILVCFGYLKCLDVF